jgi:hypothetical protein
MAPSLSSEVQSIGILFRLRIVAWDSG